jgi:DNA-binding transcriptional regulator YdaS (Cro superfamily)
VAQEAELKAHIDSVGGCTKFSRRFGVPLRTVQGWYYGTRQPPEWLVILIGRALEVNK